MTELKPFKTAQGNYRVSYDGHIMGDSRAFQHIELCEQEIRKILAKDARDAAIYNRPLLYSAA